MWFRTDLRTDDNPALNAAVTDCDEVVALYIFSKLQWEIHYESNIKHEFLLKNLSQLRSSLEKLNINDKSQIIKENYNQYIKKPIPNLPSPETPKRETPPRIMKCIKKRFQ